MKVIEVKFTDHVRMPDSQRSTDVLRTTTDTALGGSIRVDSITEDDGGVVAVKVIERDAKRITFTKRYPWAVIKEVLYEPSAEPLASASAQSQAKK